MALEYLCQISCRPMLSRRSSRPLSKGLSVTWGWAFHTIPPSSRGNRRLASVDVIENSHDTLPLSVCGGFLEILHGDCHGFCRHSRRRLLE